MTETCSCNPIWRRWLTSAVLSGRLSLPGFERDPETFLAVRWMPPKADWVDPAKDVAAEIEAINARLMSRRQAVASRGHDIEELDREIVDDETRAKSIGLTFPTIASLKPINDNVGAAE